MLLHGSNAALPFMRFLTDKISRLDIGWNERRLTSSDFYRLCERLNITVQEMPLGTKGFYFRLMGIDVIGVDSKLSGMSRLVVLFHELGHCLFHVPESGPAVNFHGIGRRTRIEREADLFALCALIPLPWITGRTERELVEDEGFTADMVAARHEILRRFGI